MILTVLPLLANGLLAEPMIALLECPSMGYIAVHVATETCLLEAFFIAGRFGQAGSSDFGGGISSCADGSQWMI